MQHQYLGAEWGRLMPVFVTRRMLKKDEMHPSAIGTISDVTSPMITPFVVRDDSGEESSAYEPAHKAKKVQTTFADQFKMSTVHLKRRFVGVVLDLETHIRLVILFVFNDFLVFFTIDVFISLKLESCILCCVMVVGVFLCVCRKMKKGFKGFSNSRFFFNERRFHPTVHARRMIDELEQLGEQLNAQIVFFGLMPMNSHEQLRKWFVNVNKELMRQFQKLFKWLNYVSFCPVTFNGLFLDCPEFFDVDDCPSMVYWEMVQALMGSHLQALHFKKNSF